MKISASNIAWAFEQDKAMLAYLKSLGYHGLEIAPTRVFPCAPYDQLDQARSFANSLHENYGLHVSSMQSILFGVSQNLFASDGDRMLLLAHLNKAIRFASAMSCPNLVFGCPKNRKIGGPGYYEIAVEFFSQLANIAAEHHTVVSIEPNPVIYGTNFLNTTSQAFSFVRDVSHHACKVNIDTGTMVHNNEPFSLLEQHVDLIHHIHISEPNLVPIVRRDLHKQLFDLPYSGYISLEMKNPGDIGPVKEALWYIQNLATR